MSGHLSWILGCYIAGYFLLAPSPTVTAGHYHEPLPYQPWQQRYRPVLPPPPPRRPVDLMSDSINTMGMWILQQYVEPGNVAFSPAGVGFVLAALYEGSSGRSRQQIVDCLGLPRDRNLVRIGMRDIHRRLRTYLNPDGFLGGLNLNRENTSLRADYENILRFYGFDLTIDLSNFTANSTQGAGNFGLRGSTTTTPGTPTMQTQAQTQAGPMTTAAGSTIQTGAPDGTTAPTTMPPPPVVTTNAAATMTISSVTTTPATDTTTIDTSVVLITTQAGTTPATTAQTFAATAPATTTTVAPVMTTPIQVTMSGGMQAAATTMTTTGTPMTTTMPTTTLPPTTTPAQTTTPTPPSSAMTTMNANAALISTTLPRNPATTQVNRAFLAPQTTTTDMTTTMTTDIPTSTTTYPTTTMTMGSTDTTTTMDDIATVVSPTVIPALARRRRGRRRRRSNDGYFSNFPDEGVWMQDLGIWADQPVLPTNVRDATELEFLVNGCEVANVPAATYTTVLPFAYFSSLKAVALEFPLDNPRYNVLLFLPTERIDTGRLAHELAGQSLRLLRHQLQPTWIRATIPSFMLRGFVTLTPYLQRLGIRDVFEPRLANLTPMTPDQGVYARDVQQSIAVNIRNYMKTDASGNPALGMPEAMGGPAMQQPQNGNGAGQMQNPLQQESPLVMPLRRDSYRFMRPVNSPFGLVTLTAEHPFLYFIVDDETSVSLIAGRIDDPLNSRIL